MVCKIMIHEGLQKRKEKRDRERKESTYIAHVHEALFAGDSHLEHREQRSLRKKLKKLDRDCKCKFWPAATLPPRHIKFIHHNQKANWKRRLFEVSWVDRKNYYLLLTERFVVFIFIKCIYSVSLSHIFLCPQIIPARGSAVIVS